MKQKVNKSSRNNSRWSESDDAILRMMTESKREIAEIANVLGRTKASIYVRKHVIGLKGNTVSPLPENDHQSKNTKKNVAKSKPINADSLIYTVYPSGRKRYTKEFIDMIVEDRSKTGATYRELGKKYKVPFQLISGWYRKNGLPVERVTMATMASKFKKAAASRSEKVAEKGDIVVENSQKSQPDSIIQKAARIAKSNGMKLTVLCFE